MKRLMISATVGIALIAAASTILWSHSASTKRTEVTISPHQLHAATGTSQLPTQQMEDMSLVYTNKTGQ
jgi:hypothetical protein